MEREAGWIRWNGQFKMMDFKSCRWRIFQTVRADERCGVQSSQRFLVLPPPPPPQAAHLCAALGGAQPRHLQHL